MERLAWICLAGAAGSGARYLIGLWAAQRFGPAFPYGTLFVNLGGCFLMGAAMQSALTLSWSETARMAITVGFLGGLTTYSAFNYETARLLEAGALGAALVNVAATLAGALIAGVLGMWIVRLVFAR
ncbi:MAG: fluoride efflux transporter CrcB [Acidimicrobiia bacterium]